MKINIESLNADVVYNAIMKNLKEWLDLDGDIIRKGDLNEKFVSSTPILDMTIRDVCEHYKVSHRIVNYNFGLICGYCASQFDVFVSVGEWLEPMKNKLKNG